MIIVSVVVVAVAVFVAVVVVIVDAVLGVQFYKPDPAY